MEFASLPVFGGFEESKHPRAGDGKFTKGSGNGKKGAQPKKMRKLKRQDPVGKDYDKLRKQGKSHEEANTISGARGPEKPTKTPRNLAPSEKRTATIADISTKELSSWLSGFDKRSAWSLASELDKIRGLFNPHDPVDLPREKQERLKEVYSIIKSRMDEIEK